MTRVRRIVSLLPGATEIVCALGLEDALVGRSHECDYPHGIEQLPICSRPRLDPAGTAAAIDGSVRALVSQGLSVFEVDAQMLRSLAPNIIVTQLQCEVCAVSEDDVRRAIAGWLDDPPTLVSTTASSLPALWRDILLVGECLGAQSEAASLVSRCQARLERLKDLTRLADHKPSVVCVEWTEPLMSSGNWMPSLVDAAGGESLLAAPDSHSPWIDWQDLVAADPDVLVVSPCGFDLHRASEAANALRMLPGWAELRAVRNERVYAVDGHQFFHRPGPRLVDSAEILAHILHPELASDLPPIPTASVLPLPVP
jgi:iron complex transport system substrate-binding protein